MGKRHSHGPSIGEVYVQYKPLDQALLALRPDRIDNVQKIDELLDAGKITPFMAAKFKEEIAVRAEAKSIISVWC